MLLSQELLHLREAYRSFRKKVVSLQNEVDSLHRILLFLFFFLGFFLVAGGGGWGRCEKERNWGRKGELTGICLLIIITTG